MGVMDKFIKYMTFNDEEDDYPEDDYFVDESEEEERIQAPRKNTKLIAVEQEEETQPKRVATSTNKVTSIRQNTNSARKVSNNGMEVCVIRPTSVEDAREITDTLLSNRTVVLNLEGIDMEVAQRIIDFTSGSCFAINGNLQKISNYIFIITPASVDISGDFQDIFSGAFHSPINNDL